MGTPRVMMTDFDANTTKARDNPMRPREAAALSYTRELLPAQAAQQAVDVAILCASWEGEATDRDAVPNARNAAVAAPLPADREQDLEPEPTPPSPAPGRQPPE